MVGQTSTPTLEDRHRFSVMADIGCLACMIQGDSDVPAEVHHVVDGGRRKGHQMTIKLCPHHHRGVPPGVSVEVAELHHGPSLAHSPKAFAEHYGTEEELVMIQDSLNRIVESANRRGEYVPPDALCNLTRLLHREIVAGIPPKPLEVYEA